MIERLNWLNWLNWLTSYRKGFPCGSAGKESTCNVGDLGSIPGLEISPGEGKGYPLQYSGLANSMGLYNPWGPKEPDMTEWHSLLLFFRCRKKLSQKLVRNTANNQMWSRRAGIREINTLAYLNLHPPDATHWPNPSRNQDAREGCSDSIEVSISF